MFLALATSLFCRNTNIYRLCLWTSPNRPGWRFFQSKAVYLFDFTANLIAYVEENEADIVNTSKDFLEVDGEVLELLPAAVFRIRLENGHEILGHLSGKMRMNRIRLLPGDKVKVQMTPYDLTKGRVTYRY